MAKKKPAPQDEREAIQREIQQLLLERARADGDPRSIELLGKMATVDLFVRPAPNKQAGFAVTEETARRLCDLVELVFLNNPTSGGTQPWRPDRESRKPQQRRRQPQEPEQPPPLGAFAVLPERDDIPR